MQIPFEIDAVEVAPPAQLVISQGGAASSAFMVNPVSDNIHVISTCDGTLELQTAFPSCQLKAAHLDGSFVTPGSPAVAGEVVVVYAWGLGETNPAVTTGAVTPTPAPVLVAAPFWAVDFDFRPNAVPTPPVARVAPLFVGLTPGQVGLYQINVQIPETLPAISACYPARYNSNVTIDIGGTDSFDGAPICVQPSQ